MPRFTKFLAALLFLAITLGSVSASTCSGANFAEQHSALEGMLAELEASEPEGIASIQEIVAGTTLEISGSTLERMAETAPVVLKLETSAMGKIYYALAEGGRYLTAAEYNGIGLLKWVDADGGIVADGVNAGIKPAECATWQSEMDAISIDLSNYEGETVELYSAMAVPEGISFALLCAPGDTAITVYRLDNTSQEFGLGRGAYNGGSGTVQLPAPAGAYTRETVAAVGNGKACFEEAGERKTVKWNLAGMIEEAMGAASFVKIDGGETPGGGGVLGISYVYFQPEAPTVEENLKCYAVATAPQGKGITFTFKWALNGQEFHSESYQKTAGITTMYTELGKDILREGQKYTCTVSVNDGESEAGPVIAEVEILSEEAVGAGKGEEPDSDSDGIPDDVDDSRDECADGTLYSQCSTNQPLYCSSGTLINNCGSCGCAGRRHCNTATQACDADCVEGWQCKDSGHKGYRNADCSWRNVTECSHGCKNGECQPAASGPGTKVTFVFFPAGWRGSQANFEQEADKSLSYFLGKAGLEGCKGNYSVIKVKKEQLQNSGSDCAFLNNPEAVTCFNEYAFVPKAHSCLARLLSVRTNTINTVFIGLTNRDVGLMTIDQAGNLGCGYSSVAGLQAGLNMAIAEYRYGNQPLAHEIGHIHGFCEQYSMYDYWRQNGARAGRGRCTNKYAGYFNADGSGPVQFYVKHSAFEGCHEKEGVSCPNKFYGDTLPSGFLQGNAGSGPFGLCYDVRVSANRAYCPNGGIGLMEIDCFGRQILNQSGQHVGYDIMGYAGFESTIVAYNRQQGTSHPTGRYFDCFETARIQGNWGCGK